MKKLLMTLLIMLACAMSAIGQDAAKPDRWHGLILDETTEAQAIAILGEPKLKGVYKIRVEKIGDWLGKAAKQELPALQWRDLAGMKAVLAYFLDGKLVAIQLHLKDEVRAAALENIYGIQFSHLISNARRALSDKDDYQRDRGETFSNKNEISYHVGAKAEKSFLVAFCEVGIKEGIKRDLGAGTGDTRQGKVVFIHLYSRRLENHDGESVLK